MLLMAISLMVASCSEEGKDEVPGLWYVEYANKRIESANAAGANYYPATEAQNRFWIPQSFIDESKSAIKQNPGYW